MPLAICHTPYALKEFLDIPAHGYRLPDGRRVPYCSALTFFTRVKMMRPCEV